MNGLPVGQRVISADLSILQDILVFFLEDINVPNLSVAELNSDTRALLRIHIAGSLGCQSLIVLQVCTHSKAIIGCVAGKLTNAAQLADHAIVLTIQNPAIAAQNTECIIFQNQIDIGILVQIDAAGNRQIAFLGYTDGIITLGNILHLELTIFVKYQRLFAGGTHIGCHDAIQCASNCIINNNLTGDGFIAFRDLFSLGRNGYTIHSAADFYGNAAILIVGNIRDHFFAVHHNRCYRITAVRSNGDRSLHTGKHSFFIVDGTVLCTIQFHRLCADHAIGIKAEMQPNIAKIRTVLLGIVVPVSVQIDICTVKIIGGDVGRIDIYKTITDGICIDTQPCHILPGNKQL